MAKKETQEKKDIKLLDKVLIKIDVEHIKSGTSIKCEVKATIVALGLKDFKEAEKGIYYKVLIENSLYPIEIEESTIINKITDET